MNDSQDMLRDIELEVELTRRLIGKNSLDDRVMAAMAQVPRHWFVPHELRRFAYHNGPLPIGSGQTISQPYIVALMSDLLNSKATDSILEIGTGSGYQAAVLSRLVEQVYSVEIIAELSETAIDRLGKLGYDNIHAHVGDGYFGWSEHAPYDGIIVTAAAPHIPTPLVDQLRAGARLVIPVGSSFGYQELMVVEKERKGQIQIRKILGVSFVPLTGDHEPESNAPDLNRPPHHD